MFCYFIRLFVFIALCVFFLEKKTLKDLSLYSYELKYSIVRNCALNFGHRAKKTGNYQSVFFNPSGFLLK